MPEKQTGGVKEEQVFHLEDREERPLTEHLPATDAKAALAPEGPILTREVPGQKSQLFAVRMWPEPLGDGRSEWRGKVEHVTSGEGYAFRDWDRLIACLETMLQPGARTGHGEC